MKKLLLTLIAAFSICSASGQALLDIRINEILVKNVDSYADDHAHKVGWIELYNSGYSQVNIAGMHLRLIQGTDTITYRIPKTDVRTIMAPQGYLIFFAAGSSTKGTFHTNFELDVRDSVKWASLVGIDDKLMLLDQSGRNVVDSIVYDVNTQIDDISYGRLKDSSGLSSITFLESITPLQANETKEVTPKNEIFRQQDPQGFAMAITAMSVVFTALLLLYGVFRTLGKTFQRGTVKKESVSQSSHPEVKIESDGIEGETIAAIATALRLYDDDMHDIESQVITINRVARAYSPWSSKIYSLQQLPNKK